MAKNTVLQFDMNLAFGNLAVTYANDNAYLFLGMDLAEGVGLFIGASYGLYDIDVNENAGMVGAGVGLELGASDAFTLKFRLGARLLGTEESNPAEATTVLADFLPIITINDNMKAFIGLGAAVTLADETAIDFHVNPYIQIGGGFFAPSFWAGVKLWSDSNMENMNWAVPLAIGVSF